MLSRIFPAQIDNNYRGYRLAIWLLVPIALAAALDFRVIRQGGLTGAPRIATSGECVLDCSSRRGPSSWDNKK